MSKDPFKSGSLETMVVFFQSLFRIYWCFVGLRVSQFLLLYIPISPYFYIAFDFTLAN